MGEDQNKCKYCGKIVESAWIESYWDFCSQKCMLEWDRKNIMEHFKQVGLVKEWNGME